MEQIRPELKTLRQEVETNIRGVNKYLKDVVKQMTWEELLANCHPIDRYKFAWKLYKANELSWNELQKISPKRI